MDLFDDWINSNHFEDRDYSSDESSVDIGKWLSYAPYHDEEQLVLQRENILRLPIANSYGRIGFIVSKSIELLERYLEDASSKVRIEDTETVLETEVYYTSKIEGAKTTIKRTQEIHNGSPVSEDNKFSEAMIKGNFEAVKMLNLYGNRVDEGILRSVWEVMTTDCRDNQEIDGLPYRKGEVGISYSDFKSVPPENLRERMDEWIAFYNGDTLNDRPFVKASLLHFSFETIHPFCDGNGRMGRLLMNNYLIGQGIESCRAVSFSMQIDKNRGLYDNAFVEAENEHSDATPFVEYMMEVMARAFETALKTQTQK